MSTKDRCMACLDSGEECKLVGLTCWDHEICKDCLQQAVELAIAEESHYPLSCGAQDCATIDNSEIQQVLAASTNVNERLIEQFLAKADEYNIPSALRIYCASKECCTAQGHSRFINHEISGGNTAVICPDCSSITCRLCRELIAPDNKHICKADDLDALVLAFIESIPEDERWLYQKCYACHSWVNKSEACNHITCRCSAQICLVCARPWPNSGNSCGHGCPLYEKPIYDEQLYNQNGYHRYTGLDRDGNRRDPDTVLNHNDYHYHYDDDDEEDWPRYGDDGFDQHGLDRDGYDRNRFDPHGFGRDGRDLEGRDYEGYARDGFNREDVSRTGWPREYYEVYDDQLLAPFGFDFAGSEVGYDCYGRDAEGYDFEGFDAQGFGRDGWDSEGYDDQGLNFRRLDRHGFKSNGFSPHHRGPNDEIEPGYWLAPDGNVWRKVSEGLSAEVMECDHRTHFWHSSATCFVCRWSSDIFHHHCSLCGMNLCRACDYTGVERQRAVLRSDYPWPGNDSYGIEGMFKRMEEPMGFAEKAAMAPVVDRRHSIGGPCGRHESVKEEDLGDDFQLM